MAMVKSTSMPAACAALLPTLLACAASAQQHIVVPQSAANVEGNAADREPFGHGAVRHLTYIHQDQLQGIPLQTGITDLSFRRDTPMPFSVMRRPPGIWQIRMGHYQGSVSEPPSAWPTATDPNWRVVFQPRQISFPDLSQPSGNGPAPFALTFLLDQPFVYRGGHLGIEHYVYDSQAQYDYIIDAVDGFVPGGTVTLLPGGQGCPVGQNRALAQAPNPGGGDVQFWLFDAQAGVPALLALGASAHSYGGAPLPLDLGPLGLPGCTVLASFDVTLPTLVTSAGMAELRYPVPAVQELLDATLYAQWACVNDARINPSLPMTLSDGLSVTFGSHLNGGFLGMTVVSAFAGSNQHGYVQPNRGPVMRIGW